MYPENRFLGLVLRDMLKTVMFNISVNHWITYIHYFHLGYEQ